jgi:triacylglycerol lipase
MAGLAWILLTLALFSLIPAFLLVHAWRERRRRSPREIAAERTPEPEGPTGDAARPSERSNPAPIIIVGRPPRARHPLVLVHGYFGFDSIGALRVKREYFRGVRGRLEALGHHVYLARVAPAAGVRRRAAELAEQVRKLPFERVNIIAHSMGGVDARYAISKLGLDERVASLLTIGTPHHGTPIADMAARLGEWQNVRRMLDTIGANVDGLYDLTTTRMAEFNALVKDSRDVWYSSVVGAVQSETAKVSALLAPGFSYLRKRVGPNDGMVPAASQRWGDVLFEIEADHWAQIGWSAGFDAGPVYVALAERLSERGL